MGILGAGLVITGLPLELHWSEAGLFYVLTVITLVSAVATISMENAVYAAIWFALSLLGTAGLFFFQGAQFVAVATIVVYAGAIVVTLLFVIMLAQPDGQATYDRISWARSGCNVRPRCWAWRKARINRRGCSLKMLVDAGTSSPSTNLKPSRT